MALSSLLAHARRTEAKNPGRTALPAAVAEYNRALAVIQAACPACPDIQRVPPLDSPATCMDLLDRVEELIAAVREEPPTGMIIL